MMRLAMTEQFIGALASLEGADAKRVAAFLDRIVRQPADAPIATEIVHDAGDRTVRSMRVTRELRAIVCIEADRVVLLYVAHHDAAYAWARDHCVRCHPLDGALEVVTIDTAPTARPAAAPGRVECIVDDTASLCEVLDSRGVAHELTP
jgi:hypothetical protein